MFFNYTYKMEDETLAYIYLLQDGLDIDTNIYKIGKATQKCTTCDSRYIRRMKEYSEGTIIHSIIKVNPEKLTKLENMVINSLAVKYKCARGREWFQGDINDMIEVIMIQVKN